MAIDGSKDLLQLRPEMLKGVRIMPFSTVGKDGLICTFRADSVVINDERQHKYPVNALIGVVVGGKQEYEAIFNPKILV